MSSPSKETEEPSSSSEAVVADSGEGAVGSTPAPSEQRPPAKRRLSSTVIEISDTESDDSDVCAVTSYQASADEVKRIRGGGLDKEDDFVQMPNVGPRPKPDDYSSSSSSSDYSSDSESPWEDDSIVVEDEKPRSKVLPAQLNPRANRMDDPKFNPRLKSQEVIDRLKTHWQEEKEHASEEVTLTCDPFRLCVIRDLLANAEIINNMVDDMNTLDWTRKKMDLFEFHQTADLANLTWQRSIRGIYELLKTEVMSWVSEVTGLELRSVSASCSLYGPGDHLLLHDDRLADRRVAFILYLAPWTPRPPPPPPHTIENGAGDNGDIDQVDVEAAVEAGESARGGWCAHMGGSLQLVSRGAGGRPADVARRLLPRNNALAFFRVGANSFHQVEEVVSLELPRLSINGWFHGPPPADESAEQLAEPDVEHEPPAPFHNDIVVLSQWVSAAYMSARARAQLQTQMERASEASLTGFLTSERAEAVMSSLRGGGVTWERRGPADRRRYERLSCGGGGGELPAEHAARQLLHVMSSTAFMKMLGDCTDLRLTKYARLELQRWTPGDYTLLPPREQYQEPRLEAVLYLGVPARALCGGSTVYVAPEDPGGAAGADSALVTVPPAHNALSLVYCDAGAASFTKYLSKLSMRPTDTFYIATCSYYE